MQTIGAEEAQNAFGALLDTARREPVTIERYGRPVAVLMSKEEYERLEAMEGAFWGARAEEAAKDGFLSVEETEEWMDQNRDFKTACSDLGYPRKPLGP
ncbi:MAG: type II toxin-antitoxin system Phd/YefM family antitoxin [bacterium]|nr:type II toxin-antitoxin system Phd/YefM family antitoxin [bacterium]